MNIYIAMTSLGSQRHDGIPHMPGAQPWIDKNSEGEEEGLCSTQKSSSIACSIAL